jgi:alpha-1,2-mannosyltransferase
MLVACAFVLFALDLAGIDRPAGSKPPAKDFIAFWAAARLALYGQTQALYNNAIIEAFERAHVEMAPGYYAFYYPPPFLLACLPLGLLPYVWAMAVFLAGQAVLLWAAVRRTLPDRWAVLPILAFPGFLMNVFSGQNGGLTASCFAGAMVFLETHPLVAGACLGALVYKPQMALAVPVALLAARRVRTAAAACATAAAFCVVSFLALGAAPWRGFLSNAGAARGDLEHLRDKLYMMQSFYADLRLGGGSLAAGYAGQAMVAAAALFLLAQVCRRRAGAGPEMAALAAAALLVTPFLYDYDLVVLAAPLAWLAAVGARSGFRAGEAALAVLLYLLPLTNIVVRHHIGVPLGPPFILCLLLMIWRRGMGAADVVRRVVT